MEKGRIILDILWIIRDLRYQCSCFVTYGLEVSRCISFLLDQDLTVLTYVIPFCQTGIDVALKKNKISR